VRLIDFADPDANDWLAVAQFTVDALKVIAHELLTGLQGSVTVDWAHRESARARLRVLVKRILRQYGYPPDLSEDATQLVLKQAELSTSNGAE
jgi:type I restriction enzyme R subunit